MPSLSIGEHHIKNRNSKDKSPTMIKRLLRSFIFQCSYSKDQASMNESLKDIPSISKPKQEIKCFKSSKQPWIVSQPTLSLLPPLLLFSQIPAEYLDLHPHQPPTLQHTGLGNTTILLQLRPRSYHFGRLKKMRYSLFYLEFVQHSISFLLYQKFILYFNFIIPYLYLSLVSVIYCLQFALLGLLCKVCPFTFSSS